MPAVAVLHGPNADVFAWRWTGSIQWIAQSPVRPHHGLQNGETTRHKHDARTDLGADERGARAERAKKATIAGIVRHQHCLAMSGHKRVKHAEDESRSDQHWQRCKASRMQNLERLHRPE